jgi:hypothetical protein
MLRGAFTLFIKFTTYQKKKEKKTHVKLWLADHHWSWGWCDHPPEYSGHPRFQAFFFFII